MTSGPKVESDAAKRAMLLTALYVAQEQYGYLSAEAIERVAARLGMSPSRVQETASFYSMYRFEPHGHYVIQVCEGLSCHLADGAEALVGYLQDKLQVTPGETTADGLFSLEAVQCLAACGSSPAMRVNDTLYTNLRFEDVDAILDLLRGG